MDKDGRRLKSMPAFGDGFQRQQTISVREINDLGRRGQRHLLPAEITSYKSLSVTSRNPRMGLEGGKASISDVLILAESTN
jgi:hypothetical protein